MSPDISVVLSTYNSEKYIKETIDSVINQSFTNWELIIIDGGSSDNTSLIINSYKDNRIKYFESALHIDIVTATNRGIKLARGKYIALLDSDNVMHKERLLIQHSLLERNKHIDLAGTWFRRIDEYGNKTRHFFRPYTESNHIKVKLLFGNCIAQPTVLVRKNIIEKYHYRKEFKEASDYDLWVRIINDHVAINIPKILTYYRVHGKNTSAREEIKANIVNADKKILRNQFKSMGLDITDKELELQYNLEKKEWFSIRELELYEQWFNKLKRLNEITNTYDRNAFNYVVFCYWNRACCLASGSGYSAYRIYNNSKKLQYGKKNLRIKVILFILCFLRIKFSFNTYSDPWKQMVTNNSWQSYIRFFLISLPMFLVGLSGRKIFQSIRGL